MYVIKDKKHFYVGLSESPTADERKALRFRSEADARRELEIIRSTGAWPLFRWGVYPLF